MLSPNALDRASAAYRKGYYAGYKADPSTERPYAPDNGTFAERDYADGFAAGKNDRFWDDKKAGR
jgi:hypothetical protein